MPPAYDVPGHGPLVYCGLQGVASLLAEVMPRDELAHQLCENLRAGDWLADYIASRVERESRYLVPAYFAERALQLYREMAREVLARLAPVDGATGTCGAEGATQGALAEGAAVRARQAYDIAAQYVIE